MRRTLTATLMALAIATSGASNARADLEGDEFTSLEWRVALTGPKGWQLSQSTSYPSILLWMVHRRPDARMLFSAEEVDDVKDAQDYAMKTVKRLEKLGFRVRTPQLHAATGAYWMDFDDGKHFLRQALLVPGNTGFGYSLTLSTDDLRTRGQLLRAFDYTLRSIKRQAATTTTSESP